MSRGREVALACTAGLIAHGAFLAAIVSLCLALATGMQLGRGAVPWPWALAVNAALLLQFPVIHSLLLTGRGRRWLARLVPGHGHTLTTTTYATVASGQLLLVSWAWTPSGTVWWQPHSWSGHVAVDGLFVAAWIFLGTAIWNAGAHVQTGAIGWWSLLRSRRPRFGPMPATGLFRICRQPIYLGFLLVMWSAPTWTPDRLALLAVWTPYCLLGPLHKERRFAQWYGETFDAYRRRVPYLVPLPFTRNAHENRRRR